MTGKPIAYISTGGEATVADVLERYATKASPRQIPQDQFGDYGKGLVAPPYNLEALALLPEANTYHMRCCRTKARDTAGMGYELLPAVEKDDAKPNEAQKATVEAFLADLEEPINETLTKVQFDEESTGQGYFEIVKDDKTGKIPVQLYHMPSHTVRVHKDRDRFAQMRNTKTVWFAAAGSGLDLNYKTGRPSPTDASLRASEVARIVTYTSRSDYYGVPEFIPALGAIQGHLAQRDYNIAFFENHGVPAYAVYAYGDYDLGDYVDSSGEIVADGDPSGQYQFIRKIESYFNGLKRKPHSTLIAALPSSTPESKIELKIEPLAVDVKEASFTIYRKDNRDEIIVGHAVPAYRIGIVETGSLGGSTAAESTQIYMDSVIGPRQSALERLVNKYVLWEGLGATDWRFKLTSIDTTDEDHDAQILARMWVMGGASPADIIRNLGGRFGIKVPTGPDGKVHPLMEAYWINGVPITADAEYDPQLTQAVKATQDALFAFIEDQGRAARADASGRESAARDLTRAVALFGDQIGRG